MGHPERRGEQPAGSAEAPLPGDERDGGQLNRPTADTVGTGSVVGVGCALAVLVLGLILAALFILPIVR